MADLKISQLTGASTPLAGTEVLPIVQSGSTVKVSVANLTAGRAVSALSGTFNVGSYSAFPAVTVAASSETSRTYQMGMIAGGKWALYESIGPTKLIDVDSAGNASFYAGDVAVATANKAIKFSGNGNVIWRCGAGTPEGAVTAPIGSLYTRTDGGANTTLYVKESGSGNTGWIAK